MCSKIELPPGYCWTKARLQPSYSQATARLPPAVFANCTTCSRKKLSMLNPQLVAGENGFICGVTLNLFAIKSPWNKYALINMPSRNLLAEKCPAEKTPLP